MRQDIIKQIAGYDRVVAEIEAARKYGNDFAADRGAAEACVQRLHPPRLNLVVSRVLEETPSTKTLRLVAKEGYLPPFQAGQYVAVFLRVGNVSTSRPYSISSPPNQTAYIDITVRRVADGLVSNYLLDAVKPGDALRSSGPSGNFHFNPIIHDPRMVCIAGGSGITPFMSMIREICDRKLNRDVILLYGNPSLDDVIFHQELLSRSVDCSNFTYLPVIESPPTGYDGAAGFITGDLIRQAVGDITATSFFLCGPQAMYDFCLPELEKLRVPRRKIRREVYGEPKNIWEYPGWPAGVGKEQVFSVAVKDRKNFTAAAGESLLTALEKNGFGVPTLCRSGECSLCRVKILAGTVFQPAGVPVRASDRQFGYTHSCVSYPVSDLEIVI